MISIIIPTHNEEKYLPILLECIKRQTYNNYEIIVSDAGSTDNTRKIARKYNCKIVKGGMPSVGRNSGVKCVKGGMLLFLDADVHFSEDFLKRSLDEIKKRKLDIAGCYIAPLSKNMVDIVYFKIYNGWCILMQYVYPHAAGSAIFCRKTIHNKIRGFDETIIFAEDMDYVNRAAKFGKFRNLRNTIIKFSMRRFDKEGRIKTGLKIFGAALHRIFVGEIRTDLFRYNMRYKK